MEKFILPFSIESESKDYVISKNYEEDNSFELRIPKNKIVGSPITLKIKPTASDLCFKLNVFCEEGSSAVIIEDWSSEVQSEKVELEFGIECQANSQLKYVALNSASDKTSIIEKRGTQIHSDAKCDIISYYFGSQKVDSQLQQKTTGDGAEVNTDVVARSQNHQDLSFDYEHFYVGKNGSGEIGMKAVAQDKGMVKLDGMVNIAQTGGGSAGYLQQETLNLSPDTIVKATPGLKIDTNDVKAGHGASVRNLNDEDLYYFAARGIGPEKAKQLMISGFLGAELEKIKDFEGVWEKVKKLI